MRLTRRYRFAASHRLHSPSLTDGDNAAVYGKCNHPYGHGHDYILDLSVVGTADAQTGLLLPVPGLDAFVRKCVIQDFDHVYMNRDIAEFQTIIPTSENIIGVIQERLESGWAKAFPQSNARLEKIRLQETPRNTFAS